MENEQFEDKILDELRQIRESVGWVSFVVSAVAVCKVVAWLF